MSAETRLAEALRAEHAAIYGYGPVGARLSGASTELATRAEAAHRARRDALVLRLAGTASPPPADPAYTLPFPVTDRAAALRLAILLEERTGRIWRQALPETSGADRSMALDALVDCAVRATRLRMASGVTPPTVVLPGAPA